MIKLGGDSILLGAPPVVARVCADDHIACLGGYCVDHSPQPLGNPPRRVHRRELSDLGTVWMDMPSDEVASQPDEHASNVGLIAFVLQAIEEPLFELLHPLFAHGE